MYLYLYHEHKVKPEDSPEGPGQLNQQHSEILNAFQGAMSGDDKAPSEDGEKGEGSPA